MILYDKLPGIIKIFSSCEVLYKNVLFITVEPRYNEVLGAMKITLLYQVSHYIRVKKQI